LFNLSLEEKVQHDTQCTYKTQESCAIANMTARCADKSEQTVK